MKKTALIIIDVQRGLFETPGYTPYNGEALLQQISKLSEKARAAKAPVIFIQHENPAGQVLERNTDSWELHADLPYRAGDPVIAKTRQDAFWNTKLEAALKSYEIERVVCCGMQTEYCVDTTCRRASTVGYEMVLAADAHTTYDTEIIPAKTIIAHHNQTLNGSFGAVLPVDEIEF